MPQFDNLNIASNEKTNIMIKKFHPLIIMILITLISCKNQSKKENQNPNLDFIQTYEGTIAGKHPVHLKLKSENGELSGNYFYDKVGENIEIKGTLKDDNTLILSEFDEKGNQTGLWKGSLINQNRITGTWSKPNGTSPMNFNLIITSENYESSKNVISDSKYSSYTGTYNSPFNSGGISNGVLKLKYIGNQKVDFEITIGHRDGCVGNLSGTAKIDSKGNAKYSGQGCKSLTFNFNNRQVQVTERDCNHHGMNCYFEGIYEK